MIIIWRPQSRKAGSSTVFPSARLRTSSPVLSRLKSGMSRRWLNER